MAQPAKEKEPVPITRGTERRVSDRMALFDSLHDDLTRLWGQAWPFMPRPFMRPFSRLTGLTTAWAPTVDMYEKNGEVIIKAEIPGVKKEDVRLTIDAGDLVIEGERHAETEVKEKDYYRMERSFGSFYRRLPLPEGVHEEQIKATFNEGVLEVHVPKPAASEEKAKRIAIS
ncbi:MAG TPA: Hsp20/alpha crystallin family protein [Chloroflexota bacterium]|nr:Hsp20/alpha crystallin family protein [Chloroflexota bacterium]